MNKTKRGEREYGLMAGKRDEMAERWPSTRDNPPTQRTHGDRTMAGPAQPDPSQSTISRSNSTFTEIIFG